MLLADAVILRVLNRCEGLTAFEHCSPGCVRLNATTLYTAEMMKMYHCARLCNLTIVLTILSFSSRSIAENLSWSAFRGAAGNGHAANACPAVKWSELDHVRWKTPIHGKGWSSPVVLGNQVWLTTATEGGTQMYALCVDLDRGNIIHDVLVFENTEPRFCHPTNSYASPSPVVADDRVYVHFGSYGTACLDAATGSKIWEQRSLDCDHWRGPGSSPILDDHRLYVAYDGYDVQYVVALDRRTGKTIWKTPRNINYSTNNGDHRKAYSTAQLIRVGNQDQLISPSAQSTIAYAPATGEELWRVEHGGMNAASRPLYAHGLVYITTGDGVGRTQPALLAIRPHEKTSDRIAWSSRRSVPRRPSPLIIDELLFTISDDGIATCLDAKTGDPIWRKRIAGNYRASPLHADGRIYVCNLEGVTTVLAAARSYKQLAVNHLDNGFQASPAAVGKTLLLRSTKHLYAIE